MGLLDSVVGALGAAVACALLVAAPQYIAGVMSLGALMQAAKL